MPRLVDVLFTVSAASLGPMVMAASAQVPASAHAATGPSFCIECHDHARERDWWQQHDGPPPHGHRQALEQLDDRAALRMARAVGQSDPRDVGGSCVPCHATVLRGAVVAGVSCETCHGNGRDYLVVHQDKGAYARAVATGLFDTRERPEAWVPICLGCHVIADRRLIAAGHPSGKTFVMPKVVEPVVHWRVTYDPAALAGIAARARVTLPMIAAGDRRTAPAVDTRPQSPTSAAPSVTAAALPTATDAVARLQDAGLAAVVAQLDGRDAGPLPPLPALPASADSFVTLQREVLVLGREAATRRGASATAVAR